jgi:hypothetical protein
MVYFLTFHTYLSLERFPIKWNHMIDKDAAQIQRVGACPHRKSRATFLRTCSRDGEEHEFEAGNNGHSSRPLG